MKRVLLLTRVLLKNGSGIGQLRAGRGSAKTRLLLLVVLLALIPLGIQYFKGLASLYTMLAAVGQEGLLPGTGLAVASLIIFVFGILYTINVFYFSQDIEHLLPLPLRPWQILTAKFCTTLVYEYLTGLAVLGPLLLVFGAKSGAGTMYYLYAVLLFGAVPVIPLVLASILAMIVMRFTNIPKKKDLFRIIGGAAAILLAMGINLAMQSFARKQATPQQVAELLANGHNSLLGSVTGMFPSTRLAAEALLNTMNLQGLTDLFWFLAITLAFYALFALLGEWLYFQGVMGASSASAARRRLSGEQLEQRSRPHSLLWAYTLKELRLLFRTPAYFLNCVLMNFLSPVLVVVVLARNPGMAHGLKGLGSMLEQGKDGGLALAVAFAVLLFITGLNNAATTSISREGTGMFVNKYLPVAYSRIIAAKILSSLLLNVIGLALLMGMIVALVHPPGGFAVLLLIVAVPGLLFSNLAGILLDLLSPKLHWDTEQRAVKQNKNVFLHFLINLAAAGLVILAVWRLQCGLPAAAVGLLVLFGLADVLLIRLLTRRGPIWFGRIE